MCCSGIYNLDSGITQVLKEFIQCPEAQNVRMQQVEALKKEYAQ